MLSEYLPLILFALLAVGISVGGIVFSSLVGPKSRKSKQKYESYECGVEQLDSPHKPMALKFYTVALLFTLFDIETIFLLPWALSFRDLAGQGAFWSFLVFMAVLSVGLFYILKIKVLDFE